MNIKRFFSALGIGAIFVAVLSLTLLPGFVQASGHRYVVKGTEDWNWQIYAAVDAYWDDSYNLIPAMTSWAHWANGGFAVNCSNPYTEEYEDAMIVFSAIEATFTPSLGNSWSIHARAWCSPSQPIQYGGYWEYI